MICQQLNIIYKTIIQHKFLNTMQPKIFAFRYFKKSPSYKSCQATLCI